MVVGIVVGIVYSNGGSAVFSYPVLFFLMKKRTKKDYIEILSFVKNLYFQEFKTELDNKFFHSDAELSLMNAIPNVFPNSYTILCSVHILRNLLKNMKSKIDTNILKKQILSKVWRTLSGSLFSPLENSKILKTVKNFLKDQTKFLPKSLQTGNKIFFAY